LSIETTGRVAGVAVVDEERVICSFSTNMKYEHLEVLMPMIEKAMEMSRLELADVDCIACSAGPGSFTGVRIGAAAAKALAYALNIQVAAVPTLDALAYNIFDAQSVISPIMDARAGEVYFAAYEWRFHGNSKLFRLEEPAALALGDAISKCASFGRRVVFTGDGSFELKDKIESISREMGIDFCLAPAGHRWQRAASVGCLGVLMALEGKTEPGESFKPFYLRLPQAERERLKRLGSNA
jgi:tRNA threonylcarbamoyladenosine biosynthesis protein TsaB